MNNFFNYFSTLVTFVILINPCHAFSQMNYSPTDDTYVHSSNPDTNYGSNTTVVTKISSDSRYAYFKFNVSHITGTVNSAILRLNVKSVSANTSRTVFAINNDNWTEESITWNNKPLLESALQNASINTSDDENYIEWDITAYVSSQVSGDGYISIAVSDPNASATGVDFYTKENSNKRPVLSIEATAIDIPANQDSYVHSSNPSNNYGSTDYTVTKISSDSRYAFYKFDLRNYSGNASSAKLKLNVKSVTSNTSRTIYAVSDDSWTGTTITWNNQPTIGSLLTSNSISTSDDEKYVEWDITSYVQSELSGNGIISICVNDPNATGTGVDFYTEEKGDSKLPLLSISPISGNTSTEHFTHPGALFSQETMDRMRNNVNAGLEPHTTSFQQLSTEDKASYNYTVSGNNSMTEVTRGGTNGGQWESDATAAYLNALMWIVTQDIRHADKCVEIFNAWKNITYVGGSGTYPLNAGLFVWKMVEAAEIIKSTYSGWSSSDIKDFQDMLVYPGYSDVAVPSSVNSSSVGSFYWRIYNGDPGRHGNQDMIAYRGMISMSVFLDNRKMYDRALRYFTSEPGRTDDIPMPTGPSPSGNQLDNNNYFTTFQYQGSTGTTPNYGYNGQLKHYFWENGQCQEASRDQEHVILGLGMAAMIAEVAYNQGDDIWDIFDNRLLKAFEYGSRYNTSYLQSYPDQTSPWEPTYGNGLFIQRKDRTGRWRSKLVNPYFENNFTNISRGNFPGKRPIFELAYARFEAMGKASEAVWTKRARDLSIQLEGYEKTGFSLDSPGWGALCFRRTTNTSITSAQLNTENKIASSSFSIFPIPAKDKLFLKSDHYKPGMSVRLFNLFGKVILNRDLKSKTEQLNIHTLPQGVYFAEIRHKNKILVRSKIVKN